MKNITKKLDYIIPVVMLTAFIALGIIFFFQAFNDILQAKRSANEFSELLNFLWQIVLLGLVASASLFAIPKLPIFSDENRKRQILAGICTFLSTVTIILSFSIFLIGYEWKWVFLMEKSGLVIIIGISLFAWGVSMAAIDFVFVLVKQARDFFKK